MGYIAMSKRDEGVGVLIACIMVLFILVGLEWWIRRMKAQKRGAYMPVSTHEV